VFGWFPVSWFTFFMAAKKAIQRAVDPTITPEANFKPK
jgi:hypothetical protein